ncbi:hypothetical protein MMC09_005257 [Bachmanniomyces sp. S44760]|nr:hypothetical protein [Bachmanniomyces sp. S44760]
MEIPPAEIAYQEAHINDSQQKSVYAGVGIVTGLAVIFVVARIATRLRTKVPLKWDDHLIVIALVGNIISCVAVIKEAQHGLGKHLLSVTSFEDQTAIQYWVYVAEILFAITITLVQLSFCFFYSRIFTLVSRKFTIALYTCGGLAIVVGLVNLFPTIFQCSPVAFAYDKSIPGGKCIQQRIMFVVEDVLLLVVDLFVVALPLPMIWGLQMPRAEKVAISGMFLLGGFVAVVNLIRLPKLIYINIDDLTWENTGAAVWTQAETCLGIVAACLPCLRPILRALLQPFNIHTPSWFSKLSLGRSSHNKRSGGGATGASNTSAGYEMHHNSRPLKFGDKVSMSAVSANTNSTSQNRDLDGEGEEYGDKDGSGLRGANGGHGHGHGHVNPNDEWTSQPASMFTNGRGGLRAKSEGLDESEMADLEKGLDGRRVR